MEKKNRVKAPVLTDISMLTINNLKTKPLCLLGIICTYREIMFRGCALK